MMLNKGATALPQRVGKAEIRREKVIQAARQLFSEQGFHGTGIAQISRASGVLVGQIYRDFANKEDIVAAIVTHDIDAYLDDDALTAAIETRDRQAVRDWIGRFVACRDVDDPRLIVEIIAEALRNDRMAAIFRAIEERMRGLIVQALHVALPPTTDPVRLAQIAELILTLSAGMFHRRLRDAADPTCDTIVAITACVERELDALS